MTMRFIIVLYAPLLLAQQSPVTASGQQQAPSQERASLAGRTLSLSGQPLRKANLTLIPAERKSSDPVKPYATASDAEGKFIFEAVEPGRYSLMAERPGYLRQRQLEGVLERQGVGERPGADQQPGGDQPGAAAAGE